MSSNEHEQSSILSRRNFFASAGAFVAGAAMTATGCTMLSSSQKAASVEPVPSWPLPYKKLDPEDIRKRAYSAYYKGK